MKTVRQLLQSKGREIFSVAPETSVLDAIRVMSDKGVGALLVMEQGRLAGIISERDYARKVILHGKSSHDTPVRDIMTPVQSKQRSSRQPRDSRRARGPRIVNLSRPDRAIDQIGNRGRHSRAVRRV